MTAYRLHGLTVRSELPLDEPETTETPDVEIRWARGIVARPDGAEMVGGAEDPHRRFLELYEDEDGWTLLAPPVAFGARLDRSLSEVAVSIDDGNQGMAAVMVAGSVLGVLLDLRGEIALHASAVAVGADAVALTGPVGAGKTTVAALLCSAGASLVTDDLLRIDIAGGDARCHRGGSALRMRDHAGSLAAAPRVLGSSRTADDRVALRFPVPARDVLPLRAIVVPRLARDADHITLEPLARPRALALLAASARFAAWRSPAAVAAQFHRAGALEERVSVLVATLPWGNPPPLTLGQQLLEELSRT